MRHAQKWRFQVVAHSVSGRLGSYFKDLPRAMRIGQPSVDRGIEPREEFRPAIDFATGTKRQFIVDENEGRGERPIVEGEFFPP